MANHTLDPTATLKKISPLVFFCPLEDSVFAEHWPAVVMRILVLTWLCFGPRSAMGGLQNFYNVALNV
uniref:Uncharacterized protein n=1 Tax=Anguilla anguilla TaxID=7936 RepID=A0A0E9TKF0_ANGAN